MCLFLLENDVQLVGVIQSIITPDNLGSEAEGETEAVTTASAVGHIITIILSVIAAISAMIVFKLLCTFANCVHTGHVAICWPEGSSNTNRPVYVRTCKL